MRLKTKVLARFDNKHIVCVGADEALGPDEAGGEAEVIHDAAAAHALLTAMRKVFIEAEVQEAEGLAAELMREWGFKEQEVE